MEANTLCSLTQTDAFEHVQPVGAERLLWAPPTMRGPREAGTGWMMFLASCGLNPVVSWSRLVGAHGFCKLVVLHNCHSELNYMNLQLNNYNNNKGNNDPKLITF